MDQKPKILLVDDQPNNLVALEAMLADVDATLVRADSGMKALRELLETDFAVILLDVQMPEMDGFETARLIRLRDRSRNTPIIFVTALSRSETNVFRGYSLGAVDYLFKPIIPEILRSKVLVFVELYRVTETLRRQSDELARLSRQNQLILNSAAEGVIGVDRNGHCTFVNPAGAKMLGLRVSEIVPRDIHTLLHPPGTPATECPPGDCPLQRAVSAEARFEFHEGNFYRADRTAFPAEYTGTPMLNEEGEPMGAVITFRDVSERRAAAMALENERLYHEAQAANRAKDEFLATLSHELRTPMTAILGWTKLLRMGDLDEESFAMAVDSIERSSNAQAQLIEDLLDVSRIVSGKLRLNRVTVTMNSIIDRAIDTVRLAASDKNIQVDVDIESDLPPIVVDAHRIQQVIWNLLSNAIKFTPEGGRVTLSARREDEGENIAIRVTDSGIGMHVEFLPFVFDRFRQANSSETRSHGGLGLGLAIVKHLVELHGGEVRAESEGPGSGATFVVTLPIKADVSFNAPPEILPPLGDLATALSDVRVLLVEDEPDLRQLISTILSRSGAAVTPAGSVSEALSHFETAPPQVVITDVAMPNEDGYTLLRKLRAANGQSKIPVIALTAFGRDEDQKRLVEAGFDLHLTKPIDPVQLVQAVARTVQQSQAVSSDV